MELYDKSVIILCRMCSLFPSFLTKSINGFLLCYDIDQNGKVSSSGE